MYVWVSCSGGSDGESDKCNLLLNVLLTGHILHDNNTWTTAVALLGHPQWTEEAADDQSRGTRPESMSDSILEYI